MKFAERLGAAVLVTIALSPAASADPQPTFGYLENVRVGPDALIMRAKLDTGADTSSLGFTKLEQIRKDGADWVNVTVTNAEGRSFVTLRKVVRIATIKRKNAPSIDRPVILVELCLGGTQKLTEMTLADRRLYTVPILVGRSFLAGAAIIDSSKEYTTDPRCGEGKAQ